MKKSLIPWIVLGLAAAVFPVKTRAQGIPPAPDRNGHSLNGHVANGLAGLGQDLEAR